MIIIISKPGDDSANSVIEWLKYYNCEYIRLDLAKECYRNINVSFKKSELEIVFKLKSGKVLDFNDISFFFYRSSLFEKKFKNLGSSILPKQDFKKHHSLEFQTLTNFLYEKISKLSIGLIAALPLNKLQQLYLAQESGLSIPDTYIRSSRDEINDIGLENTLVNKAMQENIAFQYENEVYLQRVAKIDAQTLQDNFFPSLFQTYITKTYEIRTFYLNGKFYSIAIYDPKQPLLVDYRDGYKKHSYSPISLPVDIEDKLRLLMHKLNLISGSIDLVCDNNYYYFMEVNTQGQYDWVSEYGNYNLHQIIAKFLYEKEQNFKTSKGQDTISLP